MRPRHPVAAFVVALAGCGGPSDTSTAQAQAPPPPVVAAKPPEPTKPPPDPMSDPSAWKALPAPERSTKAAQFVAKVDAGDAAAVEHARTFLKDRSEDAAIVALAKAALAKGGVTTWAHEAAGDVNVGPDVDACLRSCEAAEEDEKYIELNGLRSQTSGTWWADAETEKKVRALCADVKAADAFVHTPYGDGIDRWVRWQRAIEVMKDAPAIHGARGPYLVFISLDSDVEAPPNAAPAAGAGKKAAPPPKDDEAKKPPVKLREMKDVPKEEIERARKILSHDLDLMEDYYAGFIASMGPIFGFTKYGADNVDRTTLLKLNVFMSEAEYHRFNQHHGNMAEDAFARAYYSAQEPRFITTYDGGKDEDPLLTEHVQCHEATHQLVHLYTWDLTRQERKREPRWEDSGDARPLWSDEGFAEFFSSFVVKDGKRVWMQPFEYRLRELYVLGDIVQAKKWRPFDMKEFLRLRDAGDLVEAGKRRGGASAPDRDLAGDVMGSYFYCKAWSFVYFLWNVEEGGKQKYHDRLIEYFKREYHLQYEHDVSSNVDRVRLPTMNDFLRIMGIVTDDKMPTADKDARIAAFEKEWQAYESKMVAQFKKPEWDLARAAAHKNLKLDK